MGALKGWQAKIKFPVQQLTGERMLDPDGKDATGDGSETTFYTRSFPVTDSGGTVTDDETDVTVYLDGVSQGSTTYTLTGAEGKIVFNTAPAADKVVTITYYYAKQVGYAQSARISHGPNIEAIREIGNRAPVELKEGNIDVTLSLEMCWLNRDMLGKQTQPGSLPEFQVDFYPAGVGSGKPIISVTGKFSGYSMDMSQDAITMESSDFVGRVISVGTQS